MVRKLDVMTIREVAELHRVGETQIKTAIREGRLRAWPFGSRWLIDRRSAEAFEPRRSAGRPFGSRDRYPRRRRTRAEVQA